MAAEMPSFAPPKQLGVGSAPHLLVQFDGMERVPAKTSRPAAEGNRKAP
jgi:hypothetical protein